MSRMKLQGGPAHRKLTAKRKRELWPPRGVTATRAPSSDDDGEGTGEPGSKRFRPDPETETETETERDIPLDELHERFPQLREEKERRDMVEYMLARELTWESTRTYAVCCGVDCHAHGRLRGFRSGRRTTDTLPSALAWRGCSGCDAWACGSAECKSSSVIGVCSVCHRTTCRRCSKSCHMCAKVECNNCASAVALGAIPRCQHCPYDTRVCRECTESHLRVLHPGEVMGG